MMSAPALQSLSNIVIVCCVFRCVDSTQGMPIMYTYFINIKTLYSSHICSVCLITMAFNIIGNCSLHYLCLYHSNVGQAIVGQAIVGQAIRCAVKQCQTFERRERLMRFGVHLETLSLYQEIALDTEWEGVGE